MPHRMPRARSIQVKVFAVNAAVTLGIVASLATYFPARQIQGQRSALEKKADRYGGLLAKESESALAFQDRETAREFFSAVAVDPDVRGVSLYAADGSLFYALGELTSYDPTAAPTPGLRSGESFVRSSSPVLSKVGPRGMLVVELATDALIAQRAEIRKASILVALAALAIGFGAAWLIGRSLGKRLGAITTVTNAVAEGDLSQKPIEDPSADEVGQLSRSFNRMVAKIKELVVQISHAAAEEKQRLDALVTLRTSELDARNQDMRRVLENVGEGFLTLDRDGVMSAERSAIVDQWLGRGAEGTTFWDHIKAIDPRVSLWFKLGWETIAEDLFPIEVALEQMPKTMVRGSTALRLDYRPILVDGVLTRVLLVISDVTPEIERERAEADRREAFAVFERVARDKAGVLEFIAESNELLHVIEDPASTVVILRRAVHTLKGNAGAFGLSRVAEGCHALEEEMSETGARPSLEVTAELATRWAKASARATSFLGEGRAKIEVDETDYANFLEAVATNVNRHELVRMIGRWRLETTEARLWRIADQTRALATRLGKASLAVRVEHGGMRLDAVRWAPFWSAFTHAVRNAVDHGIEPEDERGEKPSAGTISFRTLQSGPHVVVEIADDGRGIDWNALALRGKALGLAHESRADLEDVLFRDGVSTRLQVTEHSGRGIGLGALRAACQSLGGRVVVSSERGRGTTFQFWIPAVGDAKAAPIASSSQTRLEASTSAAAGRS